ncbi:MAG: FtsW/RodA/SpoVE family cell cycle protein [Treponema sp.]|nr:FtsW/RodA/SpoVE family cell cycle protein [Treponema sp.]
MSVSTVFAQKPIIKNSNKDNGILVSVVLLLGLGLVTLYIASAETAFRIKGDSLYFIKRQLIYAMIGFVFMLIVMFIKISVIKKMLPIIVFSTMFLCLLTFVPGIGLTLNGARRWIKMPLLGRLQPSEFVKPVLVLFLANIFSKEREDGSVPVANAAMMLFVFVLIIFAQDDFSTAFFCIVIALIMFYVFGVKLRWFVSFFVFIFPIIILFIFTEQYRVNRIIGFFNRSYDLHGLNYQVNAACKAISAGGFWGKGINSTLRSVSTIPEVQADFIFAGWAEAMGFVGVLIYFALLAYFAFKGFKMAINCVDKFCGMTAFGLIVSIVFQSLLNCGVVCGALPSTGIPLPFFSSGGSSLVTTLIMCGLLINIIKTDNKIRNEVGS